MGVVDVRDAIEGDRSPGTQRGYSGNDQDDDSDGPCPFLVAFESDVQEPQKTETEAGKQEQQIEGLIAAAVAAGGKGDEIDEGMERGPHDEKRNARRPFG